MERFRQGRAERGRFRSIEEEDGNHMLRAAPHAYHPNFANFANFVEVKAAVS